MALCGSNVSAWKRFSTEPCQTTQSVCWVGEGGLLSPAQPAGQELITTHARIAAAIVTAAIIAATTHARIGTTAAAVRTLVMMIFVVIDLASEFDFSGNQLTIHDSEMDLDQHASHQSALDLCPADADRLPGNHDETRPRLLQ